MTGKAGSPGKVRREISQALVRPEDGTPSKEAAEAVHREAHGMVADEIIEVTEGQ